MKHQTTIRKRITDLFTNLFKRKPSDADKLAITHVPSEQKERVYRSKARERWIRIHNQNQAHGANKLRKRRNKNKVARKSRKINYKKAA